MKDGKRLSRLNKSQSQSKNLVSYGFDAQGELFLSISRYDKDVEKFGENVRYRDVFNEEKIIVNAHIYEANPNASCLNSICSVYNKDASIFYVFVTPPHDWFVRIDEIDKGMIMKSSMFATSWFKQMNFSFHYDENSILSKITIGDFLHWDKSR